jgi:glycosyltransferase involved in cell wall biosynthesis
MVNEVGHFLPDGKAAFQLDLPHKAYWNYVLPFGLRRASHIVTISKYCETVIEEKLGISPTKVSIVHLAADSRFRVISDLDHLHACRNRYGLPGRYILCVGNFYPHKNYDSVIKMYKKLKDKMQKAPKLVMVGDYSYASPDFFELINKFDLNKDVLLLDYVDNSELVYIYNLAELLLFPPHLAGFGIPCVEAMACGTPVVASDRGAIAEVTTGAALLLLNPSDIDEMLHAVEQVIYDNDLRIEMSKKGLDRARHFSWEISAAKLLQLYESVGNNAA